MTGIKSNFRPPTTDVIAFLKTVATKNNVADVSVADAFNDETFNDFLISLRKTNQEINFEISPKKFQWIFSCYINVLTKFTLVHTRRLP